MIKQTACFLGTDVDEFVFLYIYFLKLYARNISQHLEHNWLKGLHSKYRNACFFMIDIPKPLFRMTQGKEMSTWNRWDISFAFTWLLLRQLVNKLNI